MAQGTELVPVGEYRVMKQGDEALELIKENLQGQDLTEFDLPRVKIPAGGGTTWEVPSLGGSDAKKEIEGVVVLSKQTRSFWEDPYEGEGNPPDCSSPDAELADKNQDYEGEIPAAVDEASGKLICETCRFAQYGSSDTGSGRGQACKLSRVLFVLTPDRMLPVLVVLPPTSLKPAARYMLDLADYGIPHRRVVTRIGLEKVSGKGVPDYSKATFAAGDKLGDEEAEAVAKYAEALEPVFTRIRVEDSASVAGAAAEAE